MAVASFGTGFLSFFVLLLLAAGLWAPRIRLRFHLWRGNYAAAAKIIEGVLERHPERLTLYTRLARLYLRLGRQDERAMQVYKKILLLNLATPDLAAINAVVAQKYLAAETMDADAVEVLENALKTELRHTSLPASSRLRF